MKCIIFVNRIITARSLAYVLQQLRFLSAWRCSYLVGVHSGLRNISRKSTNAILEKFRSGEVCIMLLYTYFVSLHKEVMSQCVSVRVSVCYVMSCHA